MAACQIRWRDNTPQGISSARPAKAMRKHNENRNGAASGGASGAPGPWGCVFCCVFAWLWPAMCSKSPMACYHALPSEIH
eukprot:3451841-Heterocapsa_arctica.AAC.1